MSAGVVACCLLGAAVVAGWPSTRARQRYRWLWGSGSDGLIPAPIVGWLWARVNCPLRGPLHGDLSGHLRGTPSGIALPALAVGLVGLVLAGPVAGVAGVAYGALALRALSRRRAARTERAEHVRALDRLGALAADLRAGLPIPAAMTALERGQLRDRLQRLARAALALAEQTGAPLADLLDRIAADARSTRRAVAAAAAQAAGARATACLLAALPLGGIALGFGIGADPLSVLLHTPIGAGCALAAIGLQLVGLAWAERLTRIPGAR